MPSQSTYQRKFPESEKYAETSPSKKHIPKGLARMEGRGCSDRRDKRAQDCGLVALVELKWALMGDGEIMSI